MMPDQPTDEREYEIRTDLDEHRTLTNDDDWTLKGRPRCHGIKKNGQRCGSFAGYSGWCFAHDPNVTWDDRAEYRKVTGPGNRLVKMMPPRLRPVFEDLVKAMGDVVTGKITPSQASALAALATASVRVLTSGEMEERLRALDAATAAQEESTWQGGGDD